MPNKWSSVICHSIGQTKKFCRCIERTLFVNCKTNCPIYSCPKLKYSMVTGHCAILVPTYQTYSLPTLNSITLHNYVCIITLLYMNNIYKVYHWCDIDAWCPLMLLITLTFTINGPHARWCSMLENLCVCVYMLLLIFILCI